MIRNLFLRLKFLCALSFVLGSFFMASCSKETDEFEDQKEVTADDESDIASERDVWSFDVKVMLDRATYKLYFSDADIVKKKLQERFDDVAALYKGKNGINFFDADIKFNPIFDESNVYDSSSEDVFVNGLTYRGDYPYLLIIDGCIGDYAGERVHSDWTGWGQEIVCLFDNGLSAADDGKTVYDILSKYKTSEAITHELGHARGVPDIYAMEVKTNPICNLIFSPVKCIMNVCWGGDSWSEYAQLLINRNKDLVRGEPGFCPLEEPPFPETLTLKMLKGEQPISNAKVNIYGSVMYSYTVEDNSVSSYTTDEDGCIQLNPESLFTGTNGDYKYGVVLLEIVSSEEKYYDFLPVYEVQIPYLKEAKENIQLNVVI